MNITILQININRVYKNIALSSRVWHFAILPWEAFNCLRGKWPVGWSHSCAQWSESPFRRQQFKQVVFRGSEVWWFYLPFLTLEEGDQ